MFLSTILYTILFSHLEIQTPAWVLYAIEFSATSPQRPSEKPSTSKNYESLSHEFIIIKSNL